MKKQVLFFQAIVSLFFILTSDTINGQDLESCKLKSRLISNSGIYFSQEEISKQEYNQLAKNPLKETEELTVEYFKNSKKSEKLLTKLHSSLFLQIDDGYQIPTGFGDTITIKNNRHKLEMSDKRASNYKFVGKQNQFIIISFQGYEFWGQIVIDTKKNLAHQLPDKPIFLSSEWLFSKTWYYGESDIRFLNLKNNKDVTLIIEDTVIKSAVALPYNQVIFELNQDNCDTPRYWKILMI